MQPETSVRVMRIGAFGRTRAVVRPGWHCWNCKASTSDMPAMAAPGRASGPPATARAARPPHLALEYSIAS